MPDNDDPEFEDLTPETVGDEKPPPSGDEEEDSPEPDANAAAESADDEDAEPETRSDGLPQSGADLAAVYDIPVEVSAVLGKATMQVSQLLKLGRGAVVELDRKVGEAIDIYVNDRLVARGEVVIVEDRLGVTMTEIVKSGKK